MSNNGIIYVLTMLTVVCLFKNLDRGKSNLIFANQKSVLSFGENMYGNGKNNYTY